MKITPAWNFSTLTAGQIETDETPFDWFPGTLSENELNSIKAQWNPAAFVGTGSSGFKISAGRWF